MTIVNLTDTNPEPNRQSLARDPKPQQPAPEAQQDERPAEGAATDDRIPEQKPLPEVEQDTRPAEGATESRTPEQQPAVDVNVTVEAKPAKGSTKVEK